MQYVSRDTSSVKLNRWEHLILVSSGGIHSSSLSDCTQVSFQRRAERILMVSFAVGRGTDSTEAFQLPRFRKAVKPFFAHRLAV